MEDVTNFSFREMMTEIGKPDVIFTEFVAADGLVYNKSGKVLEKLKYSEKQRPIVAQIWGTNLSNLEIAARTIEKLEFDGIDINMGCPAKDVVKLGGGAGMIKSPEKAMQAIQAVRKAVKIPISVKTRLGWNFEIFRNSGISALTLHARTPGQMSKGQADWEKIGELVKLNLGITIIGNGDITSYEEVYEKHKTYGVDGVMIGRGMFANPAIFANKILTKEERLNYFGKYKNPIFLRGFRGAKQLRIMYNK
jgi:tRNA-dihydrouridine synthase